MRPRSTMTRAGASDDGYAAECRCGWRESANSVAGADMVADAHERTHQPTVESLAAENRYLAARLGRVEAALRASRGALGVVGVQADDWDAHA